MKARGLNELFSDISCYKGFPLVLTTARLFDVVFGTDTDLPLTILLSLVIENHHDSKALVWLLIHTVYYLEHTNI